MVVTKEEGNVLSYELERGHKNFPRETNLVHRSFSAEERKADPLY
jgi:hypothetical protein